VPSLAGEAGGREQKAIFIILLSILLWATTSVRTHPAEFCRTKYIRNGKEMEKYLESI
jgi:hypothetical protein